MVKSILIILFLSFSYLGMGQLTYAPDKIKIVGNPTEDLITFKFDVTNPDNEDVKLYWKLQKEDDFPSEWSTQICDFQLCYGENIDQINTELPNTLKAGETRDFKIYLLPNQKEGETELTFTLYDDAALTNEVIKLETEKITVSTTTSVKDRVVGDISIYPNPSSNFFRISNDENVANIIIYNITMKKISTLTHFKGKSHNIEDLRNGIFAVRLFDKKGELLKTMRIQKI